MKPQTCIFFGRSGSGKGTQANLLIEYLKKNDKERNVLYVETGARFRDFLSKSPTYTAGRVKEVLSHGGLLPAFLPIWVWTSLFIDEYTGHEHLIFDGISRRANEGSIVDSAIQFYGREGVRIIFLDVHLEEATDRLLKRGRYDDKPEKITQRHSWYETDVLAAIDYFRKNSMYTFLTIDGCQSIEKVHQDILAGLDLS